MQDKDVLQFFHLWGGGGNENINFSITINTLVVINLKEQVYMPVRYSISRWSLNNFIFSLLFNWNPTLETFILLTYLTYLALILLKMFNWQQILSYLIALSLPTCISLVHSLTDDHKNFTSPTWIALDFDFNCSINFSVQLFLYAISTYKIGMLTILIFVVMSLLLNLYSREGKYCYWCWMHYFMEQRTAQWM